MIRDRRAPTETVIELYYNITDVIARVWNDICAACRTRAEFMVRAPSAAVVKKKNAAEGPRGASATFLQKEAYNSANISSTANLILCG